LPAPNCLACRDASAQRLNGHVRCVIGGDDDSLRQCKKDSAPSQPRGAAEARCCRRGMLRFRPPSFRLGATIRPFVARRL